MIITFMFGNIDFLGSLVSFFPHFLIDEVPDLESFGNTGNFLEFEHERYNNIFITQ